MRQAISVTKSTLPAGTAEAEMISAKMKEWDSSSYAGYRNAIKPGNDSYPDLAKILATVAKHKAGIRDFVILGIGGSSLGAEAVLRALHPSLKEPRFHILDNADPTWMSWLLKSLRPEETLFYVVAKSGGTPETLSQFLVAREWVEKSVKDWQKHFVCCTDPVKGDLRALAKKWNLSCLEVPPTVGGRFSVLTPVGLFPAAFAGLPIEDFLQGAASVAAWDEKSNPCQQVAVALARAAEKFPLTVIMPYSTQLQGFSRWFCQLWAESLGKRGKGLTPYPAVGASDQHSQMQLYMEGPRDKCMVFVRVRKMSESLPIPFPAELRELSSFALLEDKSVGGLLDAEFLATRDAVTNQGIPNVTIELDQLDAYSLGALFYFWEWATAIAGAVLGVDPFDQPGVEAAKILTKKYLANP